MGSYLDSVDVLARSKRCLLEQAVTRMLIQLCNHGVQTLPGMLENFPEVNVMLQTYEQKKSNAVFSHYIRCTVYW